jgi:predicted nucleotidyltransferase component of viral defense system
VLKCVEHPYSDNPPNNIIILSYSYEEIFSEKFRALVQRLRPRDLYDIIHLYQHRNRILDLNILKNTLQTKCDIRSVSYPTIEHIQTHPNRSLLESDWSTQLRHQVSELASLDIYLNQLQNIMDWISIKS